MKIEIEIHTTDRALVFDLLDKSSSLSIGDKFEIPEGNAVLTYKESYIRKGLGIPEIAKFSIEFGSGIAIGIISNWLYNKLKGKDIKRLIIEKREITVEKNEIRKILEEKIEIEKE